MSSTTNSTLTGRPRTLTFVAGYLIVGISVAHIAYFGIRTADYWGGWIAGDLRFTDSAPADVLEAFWVLPGGFALPTIALGLMVVEYARAGRVVPGSVAVVLLAWTVLASFLMLASGFPLGIVPGAMLLAARSMARRDESRHLDPDEAAL